MLASTVKTCTESSQRFSELVRFCSEHDIELMVDSDTCPQLPGKTLISITAYPRYPGPGCIATDILSSPGEASGVIDRMSKNMLANLRKMIENQ